MTVTSNSPLLEARDLRVHYPVGRDRVVRAVDGVSLAVFPGETLGLVGESGCGKSSLGRAMLRLEPLAGGRLFAFGDEVTTASRTQLRALRARTAMVFQDPYSSLDPRMSVGDAIAEPLFVHRRGDRRARRAAVATLLDRVGLPTSVANRRPHEFSGGQLQRIGIARALALDPDLVVADEPVSALDVSVQAGVINLLRDLQSERGLSYLFVAHDLKVVELISDRVAVMYLGRIAELAPARRLFAAPKHPYTKALLAAAPTPNPRARRVVEPLLGEPPSPLAPPTGCPFHPRCPDVQARCVVDVPALRTDRSGASVACHLVPLDG